MAEIKIVVGTKSGKTYQKSFENDNFLGKKVGDKIAGEEIGIQGAELQIMGGSDNSGFPMRKDFPGILKRKLLLTKGIGNKDNVEGRRRKRTVAPNQVTEKIAQLNLKLIKEGSKSIEDAWEIKAENKEEGSSEE